MSQAKVTLTAAIPQAPTCVEDERPPPQHMAEPPVMTGVETGKPLTTTHKEARMFSNSPDVHVDTSYPKCERGFSTPNQAYYGNQTFETVDMGLSFRNVGVYGFGSQIDYQKTFANYPLMYLSRLMQCIRRVQKTRIDILHDIEGLVQAGQLLVVLGRPGSGCSTLLKTLAGETYGFHIDSQSQFNYQGIPPKEMHSEFRGRSVYQAELDVHFPHLTVRQTLALAARIRAPQGAATKAIADAVVEETATAMRLSKALDTKVGSDFIQGVSGGERKRTSIAEILVGETWLQCWDNSTRGLDSATAFNFVKTIRDSTRQRGSTAVISLYQASQDIYNLLDKVLLLYEGHQIYFGTAEAAHLYFHNLGFACPERSNTPDYLTSLTDPKARIVRQEYELQVPRTAVEFADVWKRSSERAALLREIEDYEKRFPVGQQQLMKFRAIQMAQKARHQRQKSPYIVPFTKQVRLCLIRGFQRMRNDLGAVVSAIIGNIVISIILGSMLYNLPENTNSFLGRSVLIFFGVLLNSNLGAFEGVLLWDQRPIVEKHYRYGFYHPIAEAISSMISDLPNKTILTVAVNTPYYFLANLRRTPEAFFTYLLFSYMMLLTGSMIWRADGAKSRTLSESMPFGAGFSTLLTIYTGFVIPVPYMRPWLRWFAYINPSAYAFESLMINEFSGRKFPCSTYVPRGPDYNNATPFQRVCTVVGVEPGSGMVDGDAYLATTYVFYSKHKWRNLGIIFAIMFLFCALYLLATEYISLQKSRGEVLLFRRRTTHRPIKADDEETKAVQRQDDDTSPTPENSPSSLEVSPEGKANEATFLWENLSYEVPIKHGQKMILEGVEGWINPGTLTALIGATGAGKTTLLNVLADRAGSGVVSGYIGVSDRYKGKGFAQKIGYAQQQDLHLPSATVREALEFSAVLRQPVRYSNAEKLAYVDTVIKLLDMGRFVDSVIGVPGEGLNIEQRKRLTIGVELAARPELLIFLDEPTSGLDSDTAWSICNLLRKLANSGQAIMCTIHQPSGMILEMFDRLLVLSEGREVYFGDIGTNSRTLIDYFERGGAKTCDPDGNPAEWLLDLLANGSTTECVINWADVWSTSAERSRILRDVADFKNKLMPLIPTITSPKSAKDEFPVSALYQLYFVTMRTLRHDWRSPAFLWSKALTTFIIAFINGVSVWQSPNTLQGLQNQFFSLFVFFNVFATHVQLIIARFVETRTLYEARERSSRTFSWTTFVLSNIIAEIPSQTLMAVLTFFPWYYPLGWYHNASETGSLNSRGGLTFLFVWVFMLWTQTFSQMLASFVPNTAIGIAIANVLYILSLLFSGLLVRPDALSRFWIFLYRASPLSYYVSGILSTAISGVEVTCSKSELAIFEPPPGQTCGDYLSSFQRSVRPAVELLNPEAGTACEVCPISDTNSVLASFGIYFANRWRDLGISLAYVVANVGLAMVLYWAARVPKGAKARNGSN